jgi:ABC-type dipeptide/oligopeptide/nickel transport system ATPase subunit
MYKNSLIICEDLNFYYPNHPIFEDISFCVEMYGFHAIIGRSGVGKSTLAKILSGNLTGWNAKKILLPPLVLYCHETERLPSWQKVGDHIREVTPNTRISLLPNLIDNFALDQSILNHFPHQLSSGQNDRLNVIRYLLQEFDLLILDEALSNVDELTRFSILNTIKENFPNKTFLYLSHNLLEVTAYSNIILFLRQGVNKGKLKHIDGLNLSNYTREFADLVTDRLKEVMEYV